MKYNELNIDSHRAAKRVGRGIAAGQGKTAGRGTKGQGARTGSSRKPGFTGGQNPLMQQLPKLPGFRSHRIKMETVYTSQLETLKVKTVDTQVLADNGFISSPFVRVKLLANGELTKAVAVKLQGASASAVEALQQAGGSFERVSQTGRPAKKTDKSNK